MANGVESLASAMLGHSDTLIEYRMLVKGWKVEGGERREFVSVHQSPTPHSVAIERARIGERVDSWQPHVTDVIVESRQVTRWQVTDVLDA